MNKNIEIEIKNEVLFQKMTIEFLKAFREDESQLKLSEKLGYSFNQVSKWESGEKKILLKDLFDLAQAKNISISDILKNFFSTQYISKDNSYLLLKDLQGAMSIEEFADHIGENRNKVARWLNNEVDIPLNIFFQIINPVRNNLDELIESFTSIDNIKTAHDFFKNKRNLIDKVYQKPYIIMLIHLLALDDCPTYDKAAQYLSEKMKINIDEIKVILNDMTQADILTTNAEGYYQRPQRRLLLSKKTSVYFKNYWLNIVNQTVQKSSHQTELANTQVFSENNLLGFFVLSASEESWKKIKHEHVMFLAKLRQIIDTDEDPQKKVKVVCTQMIDSDDISFN